MKAIDALQYFDQMLYVLSLVFNTFDEMIFQHFPIIIKK